ncbi:hypothetical protein CEXT_183571 [Caerostris extrusa]|uniref:Uncharacterized protein n=1 Tax=Caerostris extrusa TaxID=172846 RepID=A0AAV4NJZ2_CAEEX|nr:hypothetical protein CEXT_183571 [Caerostris extrusa]
MGEWGKTPKEYRLYTFSSSSKDRFGVYFPPRTIFCVEVCVSFPPLAHHPDPQQPIKRSWVSRAFLFSDIISPGLIIVFKKTGIKVVKSNDFGFRVVGFRGYVLGLVGVCWKWY